MKFKPGDIVQLNSYLGTFAVEILECIQEHKIGLNFMKAYRINTISIENRDSTYNYASSAFIDNNGTFLCRASDFTRKLYLN